MDTFLKLPQEKRQTILDAAMSVFAKMGYKKASVNDVAVAAGISKAAVFHYFGSKKALYQYLIAHAVQTVVDAFSRELVNPGTDFFERIHSSARVKLDVIRHNPATLSFLGSAYFEEAPELTEDLRVMRSHGGDVRSQIAIEGADLAKFKDDVDPQLVLNILVRFSEGYVNTASHNIEIDFDTLMQEFEASLNLMKRHFYKEEYLT